MDDAPFLRTFGIFLKTLHKEIKFRACVYDGNIILGKKRLNVSSQINNLWNQISKKPVAKISHLLKLLTKEYL